MTQDLTPQILENSTVTGSQMPLLQDGTAWM